MDRGTDDVLIAHPLWSFLTALSGITSETERARLTATFLPSLVRSRVSGVALLDPAETSWRLLLFDAQEPVPTDQTNQILSALRPIFEEAFSHASVAIATARVETGEVQLPTSIQQLGVEAVAVAPLMTLRHRLGALLVGRDSADSFTERDKSVLFMLAEQAAIGLENLRLREALEQRTRDLEHIYNDTPVMMHSINGAGNLINVNDHWLRTLGYERSEVLGRRSVDFLTEQSREHALNVDIPRFLATGVTKDRAYQMVKKNGEIIDVLLSADLERDEKGTILQSLAFIVDVTQRRRAEEELRQSEARFRRLVEHAGDAFFLLDPEDGRILDVNERACENLGYTRDELLSMTVPEIAVGVTRELLAEMYQKYRTGAPHTQPALHRRRDGSTFPVEVRVTVFEEKGRKRQVSLVRDVTERKRAEEALQERTAELEAFSYSVSHDLRTPLRAIDGFSRILVDDYGHRLDAECTRLLHTIQQSARNMGQLIDDLLAFSRLGRQELRFALVDLHALASTIAEELRAQHREREVQFRLHPVPAVRGDRAMIRQVLVNVLSNAVKFTAPRRTAVIDVGYDAAVASGAYYVKDNGVGFDMRYVGKIFDVFQRLHSADEFDGTGVGLAIVQRIVRRHGGRVWAEGKVDEGTVIYFTLPTPDAGS